MIGNFRSSSQLEDTVALALIAFHSLTTLSRKPNCSKQCLHTKHDANCVNFTAGLVARPSCAFCANFAKAVRFCVQGNRSCSAALLIESNHRAETRGEEPVANFFRLSLKPQPNVYLASNNDLILIKFQRVLPNQNLYFSKRL